MLDFIGTTGLAIALDAVANHGAATRLGMRRFFKGVVVDINTTEEILDVVAF